MSPTDGRRSTVVFAGGGTAGHVFPGLAVAAELSRRVVWIGSSAGVERALVSREGVEFRGIPAGKLRRYLSFRNLTDIVRTLAGIVASVVILRRERPDLVFSKGGFVSVPPVLAARLCGIPAWTHESDVDPGLATRINMRFCEKILVAFENTRDQVPAAYRDKVVVTGNPVRAGLYDAHPERGRAFVGCPPQVPLVLVLGGSLASAAINRLVTGALALLAPVCFVVHQAGAAADDAARGSRYFPTAFIGAELPDIMAAADLVVGRAGANTLAELAVLGRPSVLVPLGSRASRGDQVRNAEVFRAAGAAEVLVEEETDPEGLARVITALLLDEPRRTRMQAAARSLSAGRPAKAIARLIDQRLG
jgi:UDP-N-acetylglucosamine--N-acetylmuramyl-(pentapeptide) pyrophosphoryl-undecaprenol N-acetylglucosamine transferase